jgi:hypothetical protein
MDLTPYLSSLRQDLSATASAGDENTRKAAAVLAAAIEPAARLAMMNALSDMAAEITAKLPEHVVEVRLDGRDPKVVVTPTGAGDESAPGDEQQQERQSEWSAPSDATGDISRITLRLMEEIKAKAEQAAATQGVSLNSFVSQAVQGALSANRGRKPGQGGNGGDNLRGWTQW